MEQKFCLCGCLTPVKTKWVRGHHSRVNNISKREDIKAIRSQKMKEWHDSGEWKPWNKGLTVEDERVKKNVISLNEIWQSDKHKQKQSQRMKKYWNEGKITKLEGIKSSRWKGGTSSLVQFLRADYDLYKFWKYPILVRDAFKCQKCQATKTLTIHHNQEHMADIIHKFIPQDKHELSYEEKKEIVGKIVQYHVDNKVSGITLCKSCHKELHNSYNFKDED